MSTKQEAVNQQDKSLTIKTVIVNDKLSAAFLVPDYMEGQLLAVVDEGVLKYLKSLLPRTATVEIIKDLIGELEGVTKLEDAVKCCKEFVAFHETVNLMKKYFNPDVKVTREKPFNEAPKPLTIKEMELKWELMSKELEDLRYEIVNHPDNGKTTEEPTVVGR